MRRGRWVVYFVAYFILTSYFFFLSSCAYAVSLNMTATVPLSTQWNKALRVYSEAKIDTSRQHVAYITQYSLGVDKLPVEGQTIQVLIFKNGKVVENKEKITNASGFVDFVFVSETYSPYTILVINKSTVNPFIIKSSLVSL